MTAPAPQRYVVVNGSIEPSGIGGFVRHADYLADLARLRARCGELENALGVAQKGCGSLLWLANNKHNVTRLPEEFVSYLEAGERDAQRGYDAAARALAQTDGAHP